jgi:hypothetical protein
MMIAMPQRMVRGQMLDVVPPINISLTPASETYSPDTQNVIDGKVKNTACSAHLHRTKDYAHARRRFSNHALRFPCFACNYRMHDMKVCSVVFFPTASSLSL